MDGVSKNENYITMEKSQIFNRKKKEIKIIQYIYLENI